jgi:uncharacterized SAM-binding protein YcdF (DUF218 family)
MSKTTPQKKRKLPKLKLFKRQEVWTLTLQGWVSIIVTAAIVLIFTITYIHPFLAVTSPIKADVLVIEGWLTDDALKQAVVEISRGSYRQIFTTGGPVERGYYLVEYQNFAEIGAATLRQLGVPEEKLIVVPAPYTKSERTLASAVAFRQWLLDSNYRLDSINLFTHDTHARRSWLIYKQVLAPNITVGVIAAKPPGYNPKKWWIYSEGVRSIISESIAYIYAMFKNFSA